VKAFSRPPAAASAARELAAFHVLVALNIMCSSTCATPLVPLVSSCFRRVPDHVHRGGARWSSLTITRSPLASVPLLALPLRKAALIASAATSASKRQTSDSHLHLLLKSLRILSGFRSPPREPPCSVSSKNPPKRHRFHPGVNDSRRGSHARGANRRLFRQRQDRRRLVRGAGIRAAVRRHGRGATQFLLENLRQQVRKKGLTERQELKAACRRRSRP